MKKVVIMALTVGVLLTLAGSAMAHTAPPCNDANGDGSPSGYEYAQHHIRPMAQAGNLGDGGHVPGSHQGFNLCQ